MNWDLISCKSANSGIHCSASRFCVLITMNAPFVASICATTAPQSPRKPPISNGNSTAARVRFQTAALCAIHHKAFDKGSIGLDERMRVRISSAVNGSNIVSVLFWDFSGVQIHLPKNKEDYPQENLLSGINKKFSGHKNINPLMVINMSFPSYKEIEIPLLLNIYNGGEK